VRELWSHYQSGPLACVIINERKIGPSVYLWEDGRPIVLDMTSPEWLASDERQSCLKGGAVAILAEPIDDPHLLEDIPYACMADARRMDVRPKYLSTKGVWPLTLVYVPAQEQPSCQPG
jgi:hypothetical protein